MRAPFQYDNKKSRLFCIQRESLSTAVFVVMPSRQCLDMLSNFDLSPTSSVNKRLFAMQVTTHAPLDEEQAFGNEVSAWLEAQEVK